MASGLDHAHSQGLIHRDLKPSNIMITPHDHAKVLDLGLALMQGEVLAEREVIGGQGYVVGTMDYIAPEQTENAARVDPRSDIYALGCTLYFALTGRPPFPGGSALQKIQRHRTEPAVPCVLANSNVPTEFARLIEKMMAKDPALRFESASAVQRELEEWTKGESSQPLDEQSDREYEEAIVALTSESPPPDLAFDLEAAPWNRRDGDAGAIAGPRLRRPSRRRRIRT